MEKKVTFEDTYNKSSHHTNSLPKVLWQHLHLSKQPFLPAVHRWLSDQLQQYLARGTLLRHWQTRSHHLDQPIHGRLPPLNCHSGPMNRQRGSPGVLAYALT